MDEFHRPVMDMFREIVYRLENIERDNRDMRKALREAEYVRRRLGQDRWDHEAKVGAVQFKLEESLR